MPDDKPAEGEAFKVGEVHMPWEGGANRKIVTGLMRKGKALESSERRVIFIFEITCIQIEWNTLCGGQLENLEIG
jgi:hypothetical protein